MLKKKYHSTNKIAIESGSSVDKLKLTELLHQKHLSDLRKSHLKDETIIQAQISSISVNDLQCVLGQTPLGIQTNLKIILCMLVVN
jgi:hypothetical protein